MTSAAFLLWVAAGCPSPTPAQGRPGLSAVPHPTAPAAMALNAEGKALYRQSRWAEARSKYAAAAAADPQFPAATLNLACAFAREERFTEAARAVAAAVHHAYVPAARDALESADLAPLHVRREMETVRAAVAAAARGWGEGLGTALLFLGRTAPPLRVGAQGSFSLAMNQEIFAWFPRHGRYRQVTADDGRVLAFSRSPDGRRVVYLRAGRLVRAAGAPPALRALSLRALEIPTMALGAPVALKGDAVSVRLWFQSAAAVFVEITEVGGERRWFSFAGAALVPIAAAPFPGHGHEAVLLDARGVTARSTSGGDPGCEYRAKDVVGSDSSAIEIRPRRGKAFRLAAKFGAALRGLPFPTPQ